MFPKTLACVIKIRALKQIETDRNRNDEESEIEKARETENRSRAQDGKTLSLNVCFQNHHR